MSWGPIDPDWGEGWEDFDTDPFAEDTVAPAGAAPVGRGPPPSTACPGPVRDAAASPSTGRSPHRDRARRR